MDLSQPVNHLFNTAFDFAAYELNRDATLRKRT